MNNVVMCILLLIIFGVIACKAKLLLESNKEHPEPPKKGEYFYLLEYFLAAILVCDISTISNIVFSFFIP